MRGGADFRRVRRSGSRCRVEGITVVAAPGDAASPRVGIVAGRVVGGAVERNRTKRRLREAVARVPVRPDRDYVISGSRAALEAPFGVLVEWVARAIEECVERR